MRKQLLITLLATLPFISSQASTFESFERISKTNSFKAHIQIDKENVRCTAIGYGQSELKINVPALESQAIFDHSNLGETEPCMSAGACKRTFGDRPVHTISDLIDGNPGVEEVMIHQTVTEVFRLSFPEKKCTRRLREDLKTEVRGIKFTHRREKSIGTLPFDVCLELRDRGGKS